MPPFVAVVIRTATTMGPSSAPNVEGSMAIATLTERTTPVTRSWQPSSSGNPRRGHGRRDDHPHRRDGLNGAFLVQLRTAPSMYVSPALLMVPGRGLTPSTADPPPPAMPSTWPARRRGARGAGEASTDGGRWCPAVQSEAMPARPTVTTQRETAMLLRRLLDAVEAGELDASSAHGDERWCVGSRAPSLRSTRCPRPAESAGSAGRGSASLYASMLSLAVGVHDGRSRGR